MFFVLFEHECVTKVHLQHKGTIKLTSLIIYHRQDYEVTWLSLSSMPFAENSFCLVSFGIAWTFLIFVKTFSMTAYNTCRPSHSSLDITTYATLHYVRRWRFICYVILMLIFRARQASPVTRCPDKDLEGTVLIWVLEWQNVYQHKRRPWAETSLFFNLQVQIQLLQLHLVFRTMLYEGPYDLRHRYHW